MIHKKPKNAVFGTRSDTKNIDSSQEKEIRHIFKYKQQLGNGVNTSFIYLIMLGKKTQEYRVPWPVGK